MTSTPWTRASIGDLSGKTAVVTGANTGLGLETARELAAHGAHVVIASRNLDKANAALASIAHADPDASLEVLQVDLADLSSIAEFAQTFADTHTQLDLLINNAGIMMVPKGETIDGFERQLGTNHLGHFALTGRLINILAATAAARVVSVSSMAHRGARIDFDDLMFDRGYRAQAAYGRSKLANLLCTYELHRRSEAAGLDITSVAAHPGISATDLADHMITNILLQPLKMMTSLVLQDPSAGAEPTLRAATDPTVVGGDYFGPAGMGEIRGRATRVKSSEAARNERTATKLWERSEELTGVEYPSQA